VLLLSIIEKWFLFVVLFFDCFEDVLALALLFEDAQVYLFELDAVLRLHFLEKVFILVNHTIGKHLVTDRNSTFIVDLIYGIIFGSQSHSHLLHAEDNAKSSFVFHVVWFRLVNALALISLSNWHWLLHLSRKCSLNR